jgi:nitrate/nitrite transporter NarK
MTPRGLRYAPHAAVFSVGYVVFAYAAVPAALIDRLGIDFASFGLLMSGALAAFVAVQLPASRLAGRYPAARLLLAGTAAHAALAVVLDLATAYPALLALRFLWGLAGGLVLSVGATQVARLHAGRAATRQQGVYGGMLTLGGALGFLLAPRLVTASIPLPGDGIHALGAVFALPALALCVRHRSDDRTAPSSASRATADGASVLRNPAVLLASLSYVAIIGSYITLSTFVTSYYADLGLLGPLNAVVLVTATVGRSAGGAAVGATDDAGLIGGATGLAALGFGALALDPPQLLVVALPVLAMLAVSVPFGAVYTVAADATPRDGAALATVVAAGNVAALILPAVTGALRDLTGHYRVGFALLCVLNGVALVGAVVLRRTHHS